MFNMINAAYHDKPLMFIGATFREKLISHHRAVLPSTFESIKAISDIVFYMINAAYYDKPLILISHDQAVNIDC